MNDKGKVFKLISVAFSTAFLPLFSVLLMKQLGFIKSIFLRTQKDRIIPYIVCMIFYFWAWYVSRNLHDSPSLTAMLLAVFLMLHCGHDGQYLLQNKHARYCGWCFIYIIYVDGF